MQRYTLPFSETKDNLKIKNSSGHESPSDATTQRELPPAILRNVTVTGWIETGDYNKLRDKDHRQHFSGRVGKPEDVSRACIYLTSPDNEFITGANLIIDGGMTRKMIYEP